MRILTQFNKAFGLGTKYLWIFYQLDFHVLLVKAPAYWYLLSLDIYDEML